MLRLRSLRSARASSSATVTPVRQAAAIPPQPRPHVVPPLSRSQHRPTCFALARPLLAATPTLQLSRLFSSTTRRQANFPFRLHDIGEGIAEVEVLKWHVSEGQAVEEFDVLCEVQSDKSTVELTSPYAGVVKRLGAEEGVVVKVGQLICDIEIDGPSNAVVEEEAGTPEEVAEPTREPIQEDEAPAVTLAEQFTERQEKQVQVEHEEESQVDQSLFASRDATLDSANSGGQFSGEAAMLPSPSRDTSSASIPAPVSVPERRPMQSWEQLRRIVKASPAVRTYAARLDVDLAEVKGTGEGGRVTKDDVQAHADTGSASVASLSSQMGSTSRQQSERSSMPPTTRVEFGRTRKVMYRAMGDMGSVPHFGYSHTLDLTPLLPYMKALNPPTSASGKAPYLASDMPQSLARDPLLDLGARDKTTILSFLVKALLMAMEEHPIMRSRVKEKDGERWLEVARDGTIAVAVSDPKFGLLTPSLPALPPHTSLSSITSHLASLRKNASKPSSPGSLTISSVGPLGESRGAMPVLPPGGGVAICAVGRAQWDMEWKLPRSKTAGRGGIWDMTPGEVEAGGMEAVLRCPVGWSGDHRVLEGAELIAFTETWKKYIEEPWRWIKVDA